MRRGRSNWKVGLLVILGLFAGNVAGQALAPLVPVLAQGADLTAGPAHFNLLEFLSLTLGFSFKLNLTGALAGIAAAIVGYRL